MITSLLKDANIVGSTPTITGLSNVIQLANKDDVLFMYCKSQEQLDDLIGRLLPKNFNGLIISPFSPQQKVNFIVKDKEEMETLEQDLLEHFYPLPTSMPKLVGVTGTNGKTSVAWTIAELARINKKRGLYAGTPGVFINGVKQEEKVATTTPSYLDLRKLLSKYGNKVDVVSIEVSSHALAQNRLKTFTLDAAGWTNFTQDHLDYHKTMEGYFEAKKKIVTISKDKSIYFPNNESSLKNKANFENGLLSKELSEYEIKNLPSVFLRGFPKTNLELALSLYVKCFGSVTELNFSSLQLPPGRFQEISSNGRTFIVDYAHTPDALESVLSQINETFEDKKVLTVFGCGGNRDKTKRPLMAKAAEAKSSFLIVTSDNPRDEDPNDIIKDVVKGIEKVPFETEVDRKKAIEKAFNQTDASWVVLIAGKGHEDYQEIKGQRISFDDSLIVKELLK